jgi:TatA/E family protein of Tat protein translocase
MIGLPDLLLVGGIALLVFGPKRLPELAKALGTGIRDFKKALDGEEDTKKVPPTGGNAPQQADAKPTTASPESKGEKPS